MKKHKKQSFPSKFSIFFKVWNLNQMILKCSLVHSLVEIFKYMVKFMTSFSIIKKKKKKLITLKLLRTSHLGHDVTNIIHYS
jgi:hypothetical protein